MDSKSSSTRKIKPTSPITKHSSSKTGSNVQQSKPVIKPPSPVRKLDDEEQTIIESLKELYKETIKIDMELQNEIFKAEKALEPKHAAIFDKRNQILEDYRKRSKTGDAANNARGINTFWLKVLKSSYCEFITPDDEKVLIHLTDIRMRFNVEPNVNFKLVFYFEPNEYFSNKVLTKTYTINVAGDTETSSVYDGAEIYKSEGCKIEWKIPFLENNDSSFFEFFDPPELPNPDDPLYAETNAVLQNDFELGFYLKERVIPKAILFYTGEISDAQISDSEDDDDEDDDDDDEEDSDENDEALLNCKN